MLLGQFELFTPEHAQAVLENSPDAECLIEHTGRLLLPDNLLQRLTACQPPFLFCLSMGRNSVYLGYPVFRSFRVDRPGGFGRNCVLVPSWAAEQLSLPRNDRASRSPVGPTVGSSVQPKAAQALRVGLSIEVLPTGSFIVLRPLQPADVQGWANPAATLNKKLRDFACLSVGSVFSIQYLDRTFHFEIKSLKPAQAVCVIDCDMQLEFDFDQKPDCPAASAEVGATDSEDAVLSDERLRRCGVTGPAQALLPDALLRDALARARAGADASARRWGAGVALATGHEVTPAPPSPPAAAAGTAEASSAAAAGLVRPNLTYEWGSLTFSRPAGRLGRPQAQEAAAATDGSSGRGVRLKDNL